MTAVNGIDFGVTEDGFIPRPYEDIVADIQDEVRGFAGASIPLSERTIEGQYIRISAERYAELWEVMQALDSADDPDAATQADLDAVCALTGTIRQGPRPSTVALTLVGTPATLVPAGSQAETASTAKKFETVDDATIAALAAWVNSTAYAVGDLVTHATRRAYACVAAGTSDANALLGPTGTATDITDGTVHWRYIGEGTGAVSADAESVDDGPIAAVAYDVTTIDTPVGGWAAVVNLADAAPGSGTETDEDLRVRRELEIGRPGSSPPDAIRAEILDVDGVTACTVFYNDTDVVDADGVPPHSVEVMVRGGDDQDILDKLFDSVAAGVGTFGSTSGTVEDDEGVDHDVSFSRPIEVLIYVEISVDVDADKFPSGGGDIISDAIVAYGDAQDTGVDARASAAGAQAMQVAGVLGFSIQVDDVTPTVAPGTIVAIARRQLAVYDSSRITVVVTPVTP